MENELKIFKFKKNEGVVLGKDIILRDNTITHNLVVASTRIGKGFFVRRGK